jgi:hypothetical protein
MGGRKMKMEATIRKIQLSFEYDPVGKWNRSSILVTIEVPGSEDTCMINVPANKELRQYVEGFITGALETLQKEAKR